MKDRYLRARRVWRYRHRMGSKWALLRVLWIDLALGHEGEFCYQCGGRYEAFCWWAPQALWNELVNGNGSGLMCPRCFTQRAEAAGVRLMWTPMVVGRNGVPTTNHWLDPTRDALMMGRPDPDYKQGDNVCVPQPMWAEIAPLFGITESYYEHCRVPHPQVENCALCGPVSKPHRWHG